MRQIRWHQQYLAAFPSRGSSANNHVIAEAAGQLVASCAFPWFPESERWRRRSGALLERELVRNTFPSGIGRELASDYQCFVAELGLLAAVEAEASGHPLSPAIWQRLCAMVDSAAALLDERLRPPRQGDDDEGRALLLDAPAPNRWPSLLALGEALFGRLDWWPPVDGRTRAARSSAPWPPGSRDVAGRPAERPSRFADAGITLLRTDQEQDPEIWCRCDGGPHGYLSIAAHAHADALSVEVRYGGVDILADPGTYCYHGEPAWRSYFRSTIAHNTVELAGQSQSSEGGPFLWLRHASATGDRGPDDGEVASWTAEHDGYAVARPAGAGTAARSGWTGPRAASTSSTRSRRRSRRPRWPSTSAPRSRPNSTRPARSCAGPAQPVPGAARLELPPRLRWSLHRGETDPILGWYSPGLGRRVPAFTLLGRGRSGPGEPLRTRLTFAESRRWRRYRTHPHTPYHGPHPRPRGGIPTGLERRPDERASARPAGDPCMSRGGTRPSSASWRRSGSSSVPGTPRSTRRC